MSTCKLPLGIGRIGGVGGVHEGGREGEGPGPAHEAKPMGEQGAFGGMKPFNQTRRQQAGEPQDSTAPRPGMGPMPPMTGPRQMGTIAPAPGGLLGHHDVRAMHEALEAIKTLHQIAREAAKPV